MSYIEWVIKASTFCNLRCRYCYEWNGLADRTRMPIEVWRRVAQAIFRYHRMQERAFRTDLVTRIIWHGGEPLALPPPYLESLLREQRAAARDCSVPPDRIVTCVQTNLTLLSEPALRLITDHDLRIGVSMDVIPGVRVDQLGRETESVVLRNLDRLRACRIPFGAITVLAKHTCNAICRIYDFWASQRANLRILPLFAGPPERDIGTFDVEESDLAAALCRLFDHRMMSEDDIQLDPLDEWLATVIRTRLGMSVDPYDRRRDGESVLVVRPNGDLFQTNEVGDDSLALGNLGRQSLDEILMSPEYGASLARSERVSTIVCGGCRYRGGCDGYPAHTERFEVTEGRRCPVAFRVFDYMNSALDRMGFRSVELRALAEGGVDERVYVGS